MITANLGDFRCLLDKFTVQGLKSLLEAVRGAYMARCPTCGYPLKNGKCDACGNSYSYKSFDVRDESGMFTLHLGNESVKCYLDCVEAKVIAEPVEFVTLDGYRGITKPLTKRRFIFVEC